MVDDIGSIKGEIVSIWDKVSEHYQWERYWECNENHANLSAILSHIGNPKGKYIIEVGCGSGFTTIALAQRGAECSLLDISQQALNTAVSAFRSVGLYTPKHYLADALNTRLPSSAFDVVWNGGVIEHFNNYEKELLLKEMLRITKPGGKVIVLVPNSWCWQFRLLQVYKKWRGSWEYGYEDDMSPRRLTKLCERMKINNFIAYAFNPILGWLYFSKIRWLIQKLGLDTLELHSRQSKWGFISLLIIEK